MIDDAMAYWLSRNLCTKGYEDVTSSHGEIAGAGQYEKLYSEQAEMFFCPDIREKKAGVSVYFEVETEDFIDASATRVEIECFLAYAKKIRGYFYLVVPSAIKEKATSLLKEIDDKDSSKAFVLPV